MAIDTREFNMKQLPHFGIRFKFIMILSVLMAAVLALQFYFTNKAQQDVLKRLTEISSSFNVATNAYFLKENRFLPTHEPPGRALLKEIVEKEKQFSQSGYDSVLRKWKTRLRSGFRDATGGKKLPDSGKSNSFYFKMEWAAPDSVSLFAEKYRKFLARKFKKNVRVEIDRVQRGNFTGALKDSLFSPFKTVTINLNPEKEKKNLKETLEELEDMDKKRAGRNSFSFFVPDFWNPSAPRLLHLTYNTAKMTRAFGQLRNRNLLITALLFILSILFIVALAGRFTRPIHSLQSAFDAVVHGDFAVSVPARRRDEIGELTVSFNHMVKELEKNKEKEILLGRKERLAALGQLAAAVAHEIKNPLNAINLTLDHLRDRFTGPEEKQAREYMQTIQGEIRRLDKIVNNFLNFLRSENLEKSDVEVHALIGEVLQLLQRELAENRIELHFNGNEPFHLMLDAGRFKTVLMNIFLNAIQAMPEGGRLEIITRSRERQILFRDSGPGIPADQREHIFDLFYTTKASGTGLGLPTAYKIVKAHGGEMEIHSQAGQGTEVRIQF